MIAPVPTNVSVYAWYEGPLDGLCQVGGVECWYALAGEVERPGMRYAQRVHALYRISAAEAEAIRPFCTPEAEAPGPPSGLPRPDPFSLTEIVGWWIEGAGVTADMPPGIDLEDCIPAIVG